MSTKILEFDSLLARGDAIYAQGRASEAGEFYQRAHALAVELEQRGGSGDFDRARLAIAEERLADVALAGTDLKGAERLLSRCETTWNELVRRHPQQTDWQRNVGLIAIRLGELQRRLKNPARGCEHMRAAVERCRLLHARDASNAQWSQDLSNALGSLADCLSDAQQLDEALAANEECLAVLRAMAADHGADGLERNMSIALAGIGDCHVGLQRHADALRAYSECVAMRQHLCMRIPGVIKHQRDLRAVHVKLAGLFRSCNEPQRELQHLITARMAVPMNGRLSNTDLLSTARIDIRIDELEKSSGSDSGEPGGC